MISVNGIVVDVGQFNILEQMKLFCTVNSALDIE